MIAHLPQRGWRFMWITSSKLLNNHAVQNRLAKSQRRSPGKTNPESALNVWISEKYSYTPTARTADRTQDYRGWSSQAGIDIFTPQVQSAMFPIGFVTGALLGGRCFTLGFGSYTESWCNNNRSLSSEATRSRTCTNVPATTKGELQCYCSATGSNRRSTQLDSPQTRPRCQSKQSCDRET